MIARNNKWNVASNKKGLAQVKDGGFALIMESAIVEYEIAQSCELEQIGGLIKSVYYAIGVRKGSPYGKIMNKALIKLQYEGSLEILRDKWWRKKTDCKVINSDGFLCLKLYILKDNSASKLTVNNIGGIFLLLAFGMVAAVFASLVEWVWKIGGFKV